MAAGGPQNLKAAVDRGQVMLRDTIFGPMYFFPKTNVGMETTFTA